MFTKVRDYLLRSDIVYKAQKLCTKLRLCLSKHEIPRIQYTFPSTSKIKLSCIVNISRIFTSQFISKLIFIFNFYFNELKFYVVSWHETFNFTPIIQTQFPHPTLVDCPRYLKLSIWKAHLELWQIFTYYNEEKNGKREIANLQFKSTEN